MSKVKKKKTQPSLFEEFEHRRRGLILTNRIWHQLSVHQKINIRYRYCSKHEAEIEPNYLCISTAFEEGMDISPFAISDHEARHASFLMVGIRKIKPK